MASTDSTQYKRNRLKQLDGRRKMRHTDNSRSHARDVVPDPSVVYPDVPDHTYVHRGTA